METVYTVARPPKILSVHAINRMSTVEDKITVFAVSKIVGELAVFIVKS
jgi:hypothetical protein